MDDTLRIAIQIAQALEQAHRQDVIHRDLKPSNVMLTETGAKLLENVRNTKGNVRRLQPGNNVTV